MFTKISLKMKSASYKTLQILTGVYAALYLAIVLGSLIGGDISFSDLNGYLFVILFLMFLVGFVLSWTREKIAGIIFMFWIAGVWIVDLGLIRGRESGFFSIMAVPVLVISVFLLLRWYRSGSIPVPSEQLQWKFILRILLINYAVLYAIVVISELVAGDPHDYFHLPYVIFPLLLLVFILGFAISWKWEFLAGIIFLSWSVGLLAGFIKYTEFFNSGPWIVFGIPILLQGLFYIKNHYLYRSKK
jgi:hypothetical protein